MFVRAKVESLIKPILEKKEKEKHATCDETSIDFDHSRKHKHGAIECL